MKEIRHYEGLPNYKNKSAIAPILNPHFKEKCLAVGLTTDDEDLILLRDIHQEALELAGCPDGKKLGYLICRYLYF